MGDKERILESIRRSKGTKGESQNIPRSEISRTKVELKPHDLMEQAKEMIMAVGGEFVWKGSDDYHSRKPRKDELTIQGEFLVAENGAVWVEPDQNTERSTIFLAEHLVIEVSEKELVANMHEAYRRLKNRKIEYGTFISGPSKTADIEQSLVIGAQGPRSCLIVIT